MPSAIIPHRYFNPRVFLDGVEVPYVVSYNVAEGTVTTHWYDAARPTDPGHSVYTYSGVVTVESPAPLVAVAGTTP